MEGDKRGIDYFITEKGKKEYERTGAIATKIYTDALQGVPEQPIKNATTYIGKVSRRAIPYEQETGLRHVICESPEQFYAARAFLLEELVLHGEHKRMPSKLLPEEDLVIMAMAGKEVTGLIQFSFSGSNSLMKQPIVRSSAGTGENREKLLEFALQQLFSRHEETTLIVPQAIEREVRRLAPSQSAKVMVGNAPDAL